MYSVQCCTVTPALLPIFHHIYSVEFSILQECIHHIKWGYLLGDTCHIKGTHSLHIEVLLVKLKILHSEFFLADAFSVRLS
jgi:hypothetical protein